MWRLRVERAKDTGRIEAIMCAVKIEAYTREQARNRSRAFLE
jgi:hypothetical protein